MDAAAQLALFWDRIRRETGATDEQMAYLQENGVSWRLTFEDKHTWRSLMDYRDREWLEEVERPIREALRSGRPLN